ncbi:MAG TPA: hypothetical protein VMN78_09500 [Longimicrobiales bacterium]|nr:hypothetical protein [Longimicrobiales bacterium]
MSDMERLGWWRREPAPEGEGFRYVKVDGSALTSEAVLRRIASLAIPPAWTDVHIAPTPTRKVQAWGRDAAGRKQYRYSEDHVRQQDGRKWDRVLRYARRLPELREATNRDLKRPEPDREKVMATVVRLMSRAYFRIGSERYATENRTFGIATLRKKHLRIDGRDLYFTYAGKGRKDNRRVVAETPLVEVIEQILELPGRRLFQYRDDEGKVRPVTAPGVNAYIQSILGERYTSKDLRTFGGTVRAATILADLGPEPRARVAEKNAVLACKLVASELGNTPAVCRKAYIHPAVLEAYVESGATIEPLMRKEARPIAEEEPVRYYAEEAALMRFLESFA